MKKKKTVTKKAKNLKTQVAIILDRSSSMGSCAKATVDAFNEQVKVIRDKSKGMKTNVSLFTFSDVPDEPQFFNEDAKMLKELTYEDYRPHGMTAMYDAVGMAIGKLKDLREDKNTSYLVIVISDGQENHSREFNSESIAAKVKELQGTKHWTFSYLGANQDLSQVSKQLGIPMANTMAFQNTNAGVTACAPVMASAVGCFLSARSFGTTASLNFFDNSTVDKTKKKADTVLASTK